MPPAAPCPAKQPQPTSAVAAGVLSDREATSLCKLGSPALSPVMVTSTVSVPTSTYSPKPKDTNMYSLTTNSLVQSSDSPGLSNACVSLDPVICSSSSLSMLADSFLPKVVPEIAALYPPGKDKFGRDVITDVDATMQLEYFEDLRDTAINTVPPATPAILNTKKLANWVVKLPDGQDFVDKLLPPPTAGIVPNQDFPPNYFGETSELKTR